MKSKFYMRVGGNKETLDAFHSDASVPDSLVNELKRVAGAQADEDDRWFWNTPYYVCTTLFPEDELLEHLLVSHYFVNKLKLYRPKLRYVVATIVLHLALDEKPKGFFVNEKLTAILASLGAGIEIDIT